MQTDESLKRAISASWGGKEIAEISEALDGLDIREKKTGPSDSGDWGHGNSTPEMKQKEYDNFEDVVKARRQER